MLDIEEKKMKRLELQEIKENLWRKWRGKASSNEKVVDNEKQIEIKTKKLEEILKRIEEEKKSQEEKTKEWQKRRLKMIEDGRENQAMAEKKSRERKERKEKQGELEKKWEMLRWLTKFIDENRDSWDEISRDEKKMKNVVTDWAEKTREEKISAVTSEEKLSEGEIWYKYRCSEDLKAQMPSQGEHQPGGGREKSYRENVNVEEMSCRSPGKENDNDKPTEKDLEAQLPDLSEGQGTVNRNLKASTAKINEITSSPPPNQAEKMRVCQGADGQVEACAE